MEKIIITDATADRMLKDYELDNPPYIAFDTETTGLNIITDKAFIVIVGWYKRVYCFEPTEYTLQFYINYS